MKKWRCIPCGFIYDPAVGDPDSGVEPGTPFESLPDVGVCRCLDADAGSINPTVRARCRENAVPASAELVAMN